MTRIGLGVATFNRPRFLDKALRSVNEHLSDVVDVFYVHDDASDRKFFAEYQRAFKRLPQAHLQISATNQGVAASKNAMLQEMLDDGCDYLFLMEDDLIVKSPDAVLGYIEAMRQSGSQHLSYGWHGPANRGGPNVSAYTIDYFPHSIGAWTAFTKGCLEAVGLFDENFVCAWEHVEHELRLIQAGLCGPIAAAHKFPDAAGSLNWIDEQPGSIEKSSIRPRADWQDNIRNGLIYWRDNRPDTFAMLFDDEMPLHNYAMGIIG